MFEKLEKFSEKPEAFEYYTADDLWTDEYTSKQMLKYHLDESVDLSSRNRKFIVKSVEWIVSHFNISKSTKVIDFGCGPGLYTTLLAGNGASVTGVDFSSNSIQYARNVANQKNLNINYVHQNYLEFEADQKYDLAIMIMCDFCALSPDQRETMLNKFRNILKPDGRILLDVYSLTAFTGREEAAVYEKNMLGKFWSPDDYYCFLNTFKYDKEKVVLDKHTIVEKSRTRVVYNWLQYFSLDSISDEFEANGLQVEEYYSDVAGTEFDKNSVEFAVVAKIM